MAATRFVNPHNGHKRKVRGSTAFLGALLLGPFYFLLKGAWPQFLVLWLVNIIGAVPLIYFAFGIVAHTYPLAAVGVFLAPWFGIALAAAWIIRRFYRSRGFVEANNAAA